MGLEFTLLRFDSARDVTKLEAVARERNVPLKVLDLELPRTATFYGGGLVLSRPDQHVAWRGDAVPNDAGELIDIIRGAVTASARAAA